MQANNKQMGLHAQDMDANIGLVSAHVTGRLNGLVAQIKVRQVYKNWSDDNVECVYTFPLGWQSVRASKKPYSALLRMRAGLSSWAADLLLVGLKNLYVFANELLALGTKKALSSSVLF